MPPNSGDFTFLRCDYILGSVRHTSRDGTPLLEWYMNGSVVGHFYKQSFPLIKVYFFSLLFSSPLGAPSPINTENGSMMMTGRRERVHRCAIPVFIFLSLSMM